MKTYFLHSHLYLCGVGVRGEYIDFSIKAFWVMNLEDRGSGFLWKLSACTELQSYYI
jgi:hypothetical protein